MMMANESRIERIVEICENERCWIGKGFGSGGLLPNDRGRFSTSCGSKSFDNKTRALGYMLTRGWELVEEQEDEERGKEEWWYARDFSRNAIAQAKPIKGPIHWVRFRRIRRHAVLQPTAFFDDNGQGGESGDAGSNNYHCDSQAVRELAIKLSDVLAYATLAHTGLTPQRLLTESLVLCLKKRMINLIVNYSPLQKRDDAFHQIFLFHKACEEFADTERSAPLSAMLPFKQSLAAFSDRQKIPGFAERCHEVEAFFLESERTAIATLIIPRLDDYNQLHCLASSCKGEGVCDFAPVACPNAGCSMVMSRHYLEDHETNTCGFKIIECKCGETMLRNQLSDHLRQACPLRDAKCPFHKIGCSAQLQAKDLDPHVASETNSHLLLAMTRMMEYQDMIRQLHGRTHALEDENLQLRSMLQHGQRLQAVVENDVTALDSIVEKLQKQVATMERTTQHKFQHVQKQVTSIEKSTQNEFQNTEKEIKNIRANQLNNK